MLEKLAFKNDSGESIAAVLHLPEKPNGAGIVFLHCFTCGKDYRLARRLCERLALDGFLALRFDFSGNNESEGALEDATYTKMIKEAKAAVSLLKKKGAKKVGLAGHSMGAMIGLLEASQDERVGAVAFIAGSSEAARVRQIFPAEAIAAVERHGSAEAEVYGRKIKLRKEFLLDIERYNAGNVAAGFRKPLLVVHGTADDVIHPYHARQLHGWAGGPKELRLIEGSDHLFRQHLDELEETVSVWFRKIFIHSAGG